MTNPKGVVTTDKTGFTRMGRIEGGRFRTLMGRDLTGGKGNGGGHHCKEHRRGTNLPQRSQRNAETQKGEKTDPSMFLAGNVIPATSSVPGCHIKPFVSACVG